MNFAPTFIGLATFAAIAFATVGVATVPPVRTTCVTVPDDSACYWWDNGDVILVQTEYEHCLGQERVRWFEDGSPDNCD
jgi:hypothetical protein